MNSSQVKGLAVAAGFDHARTAANQFILFDDDTDGRSGRCVYIDQSILSKFTGFKKSASNDLRYVFHRIKQLKAIAGNLASHFDPAKPQDRVSLLGKAQVTYTIRQHTDSKGLPAGVYIKDINLARFDNVEPGLYRVKQQRRGFSFVEERLSKIPTTRAAINGLCRDAHQAATKILPAMIDKAYGHRKWEKEAGSKSQDDSYTLFFNPPELYSKGKKLKSQAFALNHKVTASRLKQALLEAQRRKHKVQWTVHGDGIHALHGALKSIGKQDLSCHTALFLSPNKDITQVLPLMQQSSMQLHEDVYKTHDADLISQDAQSGNGARLQKQLLSMGFAENDAAAHKTDANEYVWKKAGLLTGTLGASFGITTALLTPGITIPAVTVAGTVAAAMGAKGMVDKVNAGRNMTNLGRAEPATNPHLNPYLSKTQMNQQANAHYKAKGVSFVKRVLGQLS